VIALAVLGAVQGDWIGVWIAKHGRVKSAANPGDALSNPEPA
jgi:membrane protein DedA with SNARE-associated domain